MSTIPEILDILDTETARIVLEALQRLAAIQKRCLELEAENEALKKRLVNLG